MSGQKIIVAPNAFKGALSAEEAASAIRKGLLAEGKKAEIIEIPIADGGDGSLQVLNKYLEAEINMLSVRGPLGSQVKAKWGFNRQKKLGILELAESSGIRLLKPEQLNPMHATSYGTGQLILHAIQSGAKEIYLTVGGSATVDFGIGILEALGVRFFNGEKEMKNLVPANFMDIDRLDIENLEVIRKTIHFSILCDVNNPLLGTEGAAHIFGPQKGADKQMVDQLEEVIAHVAGLLEEETGISMTGISGGGAAGGVSAGLYAALGAKILNGGEKILELAQFQHHLDDASLVITGEGKIDEQTNYGKGPGLVAQLAHEAGVRVIGLSGSLDEDTSRIKYFDQLIAISDKSDPLEIAMQKTSLNLEKAARLLTPDS